MASNLRVVRSDLEQLLRDTTLTTLAFAIALGWSLFQVVSGLGYLITVTLQKSSPDDLYRVGPLSFTLGRRVFIFQPLLQGLVEFAAVIALVFFVQRRRTQISS